MKSPLVGNTFVLSGGAEMIAQVLSLLSDAGITTKANPDVYVRAYKHFGIEEARELISRAVLRAARGRRVFIVAAPDMNREAQNALLKTLEEPPGDALFFFILPSPHMLLPTLRSRLQTLSLSREEGEERTDTARFLSAEPQKRLDLLKPLLEKDEDDKRDLGAILSFLSGLERELEKSRHLEGLHAIYRARKYIADKGALVKPLLEQVALLVPKA